jgi:hypothetical protein
MAALIFASSSSNDAFRAVAVLLAGADDGFDEHDDKPEDAAGAPARAPPSTARRGTNGATIDRFAAVTMAAG